MRSIIKEDIWNFDKSGIRISVAKDQYIYTKKGKEIFMPHRNNRELITLIEAIGASGDYIEPIIVLKAATTIEKWCMDLPDEYMLNTSKTGYSND